MGDFDVNYIVDKYWDTIKEEINVKDIQSFDDGIKITKIFKPLWSALSAKFSKDTGNIIKYWKMWNITELGEWRIKVFDDSGNEWILEKEDYEISYQGLDWDDVAVDGGVIVKLDLELTPELEMEWVAREMSRFLNQMRKDADFAVENKVKLNYYTESHYLKTVLNKFSEDLKWEALLTSIEEWQTDWTISAEFTSWDESIFFILTQ